jgi:AcrR family transcriptional regulator
MGQSGSVPGLTGERPTRKGSRTRERILAAAVELFAERGYHATSLSDIGERANIQRGALYYHIRAKEELLFEVLRQHVEFVLHGVRQIASEPIGAQEKFRRLIIFQTKALLERHDEITVYTRDSYALTGDRRMRLRGLQGEVEQTWKRVLIEGQEAGELRRVNPVVIKCILGLVNSPNSWFRTGGGLASAQVAELVADLAMCGIGMTVKNRVAHKMPRGETRLE